VRKRNSLVEDFHDHLSSPSSPCSTFAKSWETKRHGVSDVVIARLITKGESQAPFVQFQLGTSPLPFYTPPHFSALCSPLLTLQSGDSVKEEEREEREERRQRSDNDRDTPSNVTEPRKKIYSNKDLFSDKVSPLPHLPQSKTPFKC
jgi:hypothetical protein